jgi:hypothetical protein
MRRLTGMLAIVGTLVCTTGLAHADQTNEEDIATARRIALIVENKITGCSSIPFQSIKEECDTGQKVVFQSCKEEKMSCKDIGNKANRAKTISGISTNIENLDREIRILEQERDRIENDQPAKDAKLTVINKKRHYCPVNIRTNSIGYRP